MYGVFTWSIHTSVLLFSFQKRVLAWLIRARARAYLQENSKIKGAIEIHAFNVNRYDVLFVIKIPGRQARFSFCDVDVEKSSRRSFFHLVSRGWRHRVSSPVGSRLIAGSNKRRESDRGTKDRYVGAHYVFTRAKGRADGNKSLEERTRGIGIRETRARNLWGHHALQPPVYRIKTRRIERTPADRHRLACLWRSIEKIRLTRARIVSTGRRDINLISKPRFDVYEVRARIHPRDWNAGIAEIKSSRKNKGSHVPAGYHVPLIKSKQLDDPHKYVCIYRQDFE